MRVLELFCAFWKLIFFLRKIDRGGAFGPSGRLRQHPTCSTAWIFKTYVLLGGCIAVGLGALTPNAEQEADVSRLVSKSRKEGALRGKGLRYRREVGERESEERRREKRRGERRGEIEER